ncbi:MAG: hypothetical protein ABW178_04565 [Pseudoxanthomonas sp.]
MRGLTPVLLAGVAAGICVPAIAQDAAECTAQRLARFIGPTGVHQAWPTTTLPAALEPQLGVLIADQGNIADGYEHRLLVDRAQARAYVVQRGGFAGRQTVYGPLPVAACPIQAN